MRWLALVFGLALVALIMPADAVVTLLEVDQDDKTYTLDESITFNGKSSVGERQRIQVIIITPSDKSLNCIELPYCDTVTTGKRGVFEWEPIPAREAFSAPGIYSLRVHDGKEADALVALVKSENGMVKFLGSVLEINSITRKTINAGEQLKFKISLTDSTHKDVAYTLEESAPPGAIVNDKDEFVWSPSDSEVSHKAHEIKIIAMANEQTAETEVEIRVNARAPVVQNGVSSLTTDKVTYDRTETMVFRGETTGVSGTPQIKIAITLEGEPISVERARLAGGTFTASGISVSDIFTSEGDYKVTATVVDDKKSNPYVTYVKVKGTTITHVGPQLTLLELSEQYATVSKPVEFTILPTDPTFRNLEFEITDGPTTARIKDTGVFKWTPTASDAGSGTSFKDHTIKVKAKYNDQTATLDVVIKVRAVTSASTNEQETSTTTTEERTATTTTSSESSKVISIATDKTMYASTEKIIFKGTTSNANAREAITVTVISPGGKQKIHSGLTTDMNTFTHAPRKITDFFSSAGIYKVTAFTQQQDKTTSPVIKFEYENRRAILYFETPLVLKNVSPQTVDAGSKVSFSIKPTSDMYDNLDWSIGDELDGARISSSGEFTWTPAESLVSSGSQSFTVNITATDGPQTASKSVTITVNKPEAKPEPEAPREETRTTEPEPGPPKPDPRFASSMTQGSEPQIYVDRYNSDPTYKAWFDSNFAGLTIEKAAGLDTRPPPPAPEAPKPDPRFASSMTQGDNPQIYVDRYNSDPTYKAWFDSNFAGLTIEKAAGLDTRPAPDLRTPEPPTTPTVPVPPTTPTPPIAPTVSEPHPRFASFIGHNEKPEDFVTRYYADANYKEWFDLNFADLTIEEATGVSGTSTPSVPVPVPAPEPDERFVPYMTSGMDASVYVDRYNNDPTYREWFDASFPDLTIQKATGYVEVPDTCPPGYTLQSGICKSATATPVPQSGGCLIATAAYGSEMAPQVQELREVRDYVITTDAGASFMSAFHDIYYAFSPTVADLERQSPEVRTLVRALITPMVSSLSIMSLADSEGDVVSLGIAVIALNIGMYVAAPVAAATAIRRLSR